MYINIEDFDKLIHETSPKKGCLVLGDIILDKYISGSADRVSPEAPIPVIHVQKERSVLGGAANVAGNIRGYHVNTFLAGVIGTDIDGDDVINKVEASGIRFVGVRTNTRSTIVKTRIIAMNQQLVRIDKEETDGLGTDIEEELINNIKAILSDISVAVLSDYNKGVCSEFVCKEIIKLCNEHKIPVIVDPKNVDWTRYNGASLITPNFKEFVGTLGYSIRNIESDIQDAAVNILRKYSIERVLVTRSQYGMTSVSAGGITVSFDSVQQEVFDVSGAGDTVVGTIAALLARELSYDKAIEIANYAAGLAVSKAGTYTVTLDEVIQYINRLGALYQGKIMSQDDAIRHIHTWKEQGERIVFTNGCFDILHLGHVDYLGKARMLGTKLIIGLNSDASVKRLKGDSRPINSESARAALLAALQCVDAVVVFDEDTPENLISSIKPNYLVKGGDYNIDEVVGREYADETVIIPFTEGYSTTSIIEKMK